MAEKTDGPVDIHIDDRGRVTASVAEIEQVDDAWAIAIGRFIVAFANLEEWTRRFLRTFGVGAEKEIANDHRLRPRLAAMETVVARLRPIDKVQARFDSAIRRFRDLTPNRNLLAHHPPAVHVYTETLFPLLRYAVQRRWITDPGFDIDVSAGFQVADKIAKEFPQIPTDQRYSYNLLDVLVSLRNDLAHGTYMLVPGRAFDLEGLEALLRALPQ